MAHKKALLDKFYLSTGSSDSSDCRSPVFDGRNWLIPETSSSQAANTSEEDPDVQGNNHPGMISSNNQRNPPPSTSGTQIQPANFQEVEGSDSNWKNFQTDTSPPSTTKTSGSSGVTVPFLGTSAHPITPSSSSDAINTNEVVPQEEMAQHEESSDETIIVTSTPVRGDPLLPEKRRHGDRIWELNAFCNIGRRIKSRDK